jgi:hypothetical protein
MPMTVQCSVCGKEHTKQRVRIFAHYYCSRECLTIGRRGLSGGVSATCAHCEKEFWMPPSRLKRGLKNGLLYCSWDCRRQHYQGSEHHTFKGRYKNSFGYIIIRGELVPEAFKSMLTVSDHVREHRLVMAQHLGRPLEEWEVVHHKNHIKDDNRLENLELHGTHEHMGITHYERRLETQVLQLQIENMVLRMLLKIPDRHTLVGQGLTD